MRAVDHYMACMRYVGVYAVQYADMYSKFFLQYLN
jgi:hypothetical protein